MSLLKELDWRKTPIRGRIPVRFKLKEQHRSQGTYYYYGVRGRICRQQFPLARNTWTMARIRRDQFTVKKKSTVTLE